MTEVAILAGAFFVVAGMYSTVGHGGASGYLMVMGIVGLCPDVMKPTALVLNLVVATTGILRFARVGGFRWRTLWPFVVTSVPCAFLGGAARLDPEIYRRLVGVVLLVAAFRLAFKLPARDAPEPVRSVPVPAGLLWGAAIGLLSGLVGVGGGIFLSPVLLLVGWATARVTAGVSAAFILVNSAAGLSGFVVAHQALPLEPGPTTVFAVCVLAGGVIGSGVGSRRFGHVTLRRTLAVVLLVAAGKMILLPPSAPSGEPHEEADPAYPHVDTP